MTPQTATLQTLDSDTSTAVAGSSTAHQLSNNDHAEVVEFLKERPLHNVVMNGFIHDNGIESDLNRGSFYGSRNEAGNLEGIALIGHAIFMEARTGSAFQALAQVARQRKRPHMILGEQHAVQSFWDLYQQDEAPPHECCREILLELTSPAESWAPLPALRQATREDLSLVMPVHAAMACRESGTNPLEIDAEGFRVRCLRRIEQGRVWILTKGGQLVFKADIVSETPDVNYIEGVYVHPDEHGKGYGSRCMTQLARYLLRQTASIAVLVNEAHHDAQGFFRKIGFVPRAEYQTIFLNSTSTLARDSN